MPIRWKLFRIANYAHLFCVGAILAWIIVLTVAVLNTTSMVLAFGLTIFCGVLLMANALFNLWWLERCYPDKQPGEGVRSVSTILFTLSIIILLPLLVINYLIITEMLHSPPEARNDSYLLLVLLGFAGILVSGVFLLWNQVVLRREIWRNYRQRFQDFLETEG